MRKGHMFYSMPTFGILCFVGSVTLVCADNQTVPKSSTIRSVMIDDIVDKPLPPTSPPTSTTTEFETEDLPDMCSSKCNNPYCCPKQDMTKPWPCGNPYGCAPWKCADNTWMCMPPKDIPNVWNCAGPTNCKPPGPNPWNCTSPWDCVVPEQVKRVWGCTHPWNCNAVPNNVYNCSKPYECRPPDVVMDCIKNPQPSCVNTVETVQKIPAWLFIIMMMNAHKLAPQASVPLNIQQNQNVSWNGQQYVVVNVSVPQQGGSNSGSGQGFDVSSGTSVRDLDLSHTTALVTLMVVVYNILFNSPIWVDTYMVQ